MYPNYIVLQALRLFILIMHALLGRLGVVKVSYSQAT